MNAAQQARVDAEQPVGGIAVPTESAFEIAVWLVPNGSKFVTLVDGSLETWESYCNECRAKARARDRARHPRDWYLSLRESGGDA